MKPESTIVEQGFSAVLHEWGAVGVLVAALMWMLYQQHRWFMNRKPDKLDDTRIVEAIKDLADANNDLRTEISVGFKGLEKTLETFIKMQK